MKGRWFMRWHSSLPIVFVSGLVACGSDADAPDAASPPKLWPAQPAFVPRGSLVSEHPAAFERISRWGTHVSGPVEERPDVGHRGAFGTGNGYTFGFVGEADPLNTLHSLTSPTYQRRPRFYGDYAIALAEPGGEPAAFEEEWAARSLSARVLLTRGTLGSLRLDTIDFAPSSDDAALHDCFLRIVTVSNDGNARSAEREIVVSPENAVSEAAPGLMQEVLDARNLTSGFRDGDVRVDGGALRRKLPPIDPGGEAQTVLFHCGGEGTVITTPPTSIDLGVLLDQEAASYQAWEGKLLQIDVPDPMVSDLLDGLKMTLRVQTSAGGATCPMSNYTGTWARDNIGPVLALLQFGAHEDVAKLMDYIYGAILTEGDLSNSYDADLELTTLPPAPDWDTLAPLSGRTASETPSYVVWTYGAWYRHTGQLERARDRFGLLRRCLLAQEFGPDALLPFTGDETYRTAMSVAFDLDLTYAFEDKSWSANSSLLWLGAERQFVELASALGMDADVALAEAKLAEVQAGFDDHYWLPNGCVSPFLDRDTLEAAARPFEDVALKLTWAGAMDGDDPRAIDATACVMDELRLEAGRVQSQAAERYRSFPLLPPLEVGVLTGMVPGYTLSALAATGHPEAQDAFNVMGRAASTSGNYAEYMIADDLSGLTLVYDTVGVLGDYTAKFRPWEGGINAAAMLGYLAGFEPDQANRRLVFRPHLPNGWPSMALKGFRAGDARFDLEVSRSEGARLVRITSGADDEYEVVLHWDAPAGAALGITLDGEPLEAEQAEQFGQQTLTTATFTLPAGAARELSID